MSRLGTTLSAMLFSTLAASAAANCITDTSQTDFQTGVASNVDLAASPGDVLLSQSSSGGTVDQQNLTYSQYGDEFSTTQWLAQTFTPGTSGSLTRVDVNFACAGCSGTPSPITVSIRATNAGVLCG